MMQGEHDAQSIGDRDFESYASRDFPNNLHSNVPIGCCGFKKCTTEQPRPKDGYLGTRGEREREREREQD